MKGISRSLQAMPSLKALIRCRLCWRVTVAVFGAIFLVEAVILYVSVRDFERDRLAQVEREGLAVLGSLFLTHSSALESQRLMPIAARLTRGTVLVGGAVFEGDGTEVGVFGEAPSLGLASPSAVGAPDGVRNAEGTRMDVIWSPGRLGVPNVVVARLDTSRVGGEVMAYVGRIIGLVFLVSAVVTVVAMMVLGRTVIFPFLDLRARMLAAGGHPTTPEDYIVPVARDDEIGDVMEAFNGMLKNLAAGILVIRAKEKDLAHANETLEHQVEERTAELTGLNRELRREIAERGRAEREIARLSRIPEENPHPVLRVSDDAIVLYANGPSAVLLEYWGIGVGGRLPQPWAGIVGDVFQSGMRNEQEMTTGERVFILTLQPESECVNIYGRDITARMEAEKRLRHISNHDMLTGLPNRALFLDRLDQALGHARRNEGRGAVLLIDLDNFKDVNDTLGHSAGDALLQATADRLGACVGETDTLARLGGDEFAIILLDPLDADEVAAVAQRIVNNQSRPFTIDGQTLHSSASVGVIVFSGGAPGDILRGADVALYRAKGEGRGTYRFFNAGMNEEVQRRQALEQDFRMAIERQEFVLFYQPKLHLKSNRVEGVEALIRWRHPDRGLLPPGEFIPMAERSKLIVPMGNWAIREACAQNKAWQDAGLPPVRVAVNLSAVQFRRRHLKDHIAKVLDDTGLDPGCLELEITESIAMDEARAATMNELDSMGVLLSLDDFGTGYSNLSSLHDFPLRRVKIDRAFVEGIGRKPNAGAIARAVITLGHNLGMEVTAEGVETQEQLKFLADLGCDEIQGFHFCHPLPADDVLPFLDRHGH